MQLLSLRTSLETTLVDVLGTYTLPNGSTTPAISVRATGETLPAGTQVTGLEVIILRDPNPEPATQYRNTPTFQRWEVTIVDWSSEHVLAEIAARLIDAYPGARAEQMQVPRGVGPTSQLRLEIQTNPDPLPAC